MHLASNLAIVSFYGRLCLRKCDTLLRENIENLVIIFFQLGFKLGGGKNFPGVRALKRHAKDIHKQEITPCTKCQIFNDFEQNFDTLYRNK